MENHPSISITDQKILQFYNSNPHFDPEAILLKFIDILDISFKNAENINFDSKLEEIHQVVTENAIKQKQLQTSIIDLKDSIETIPEHLLNLKSQMISNIQILFSNTTAENIKSMENLICQNITSLENKIMNILFEQQPKNNESVVNALRSFISECTSEVKLQILSSNSKEELQSVVNTLNQNFTPILQQVQEHLRHFDNSSKKGKISETLLFVVLNKLFPDAEITDTSKTAASCDFAMSRPKKPDILFENKDYQKNVPFDEVKKFERDLTERDRSGIFLSQKTGIAHKSHFQIDIINNHCVAVYIHQADYSSEYIAIAVRIIDELQPRLVDCIQNNHSIPIPREVLEHIAYDYNIFLSHQIKMIEDYKRFNKSFLQDLENIKFPNLSQLLYINNIIKNVKKNGTEFVCEKCNRVFTSKKGLNIHIKKCNPSSTDANQTQSPITDSSHHLAVDNSLPDSNQGNIDHYFDPTNAKIDPSNNI